MSYQFNLAIRFYEIAKQHPRRIAFQYPDGFCVDFRTLNEVSNQIARFLTHNGLSKGDVLAIFNEKSFMAYALMLACLKKGIIYTNLDVSSPLPRLEKILRTCLPKSIVFDKKDESLERNLHLAFSEISLYSLDDKATQNQILNLGTDDLKESFKIHGGAPAYIMFTSGSTGFPKGAVMSHNNVLNFIEWGRETFEVTGEDIFTNANPIYFDNSVFDFYVSLFNGARLVPLRHDLVKSATELISAINASKCTIWFSVPSLLVYLLTTKALKKEDFGGIKKMSFGGEGFPKNKLKQLFDLFHDRMTLYNVYGPTECTCICSSYIITEKDFENMNELAPLGHMAPNFGYKIIPLDKNREAIGELALIGPCVGLGYYNDEERTLQSFMQNPDSPFRELMYKTGDIVERADTGYLFFKGRVDNQIKHMGYRIELEEVEAAFSTLDYIDEVGVVYERLNPELGQIKAFVSVSRKGANIKEILRDIKALLPPYMIPRVIKIIDILPKNANGKIDRRQLSTL